MNMFQKIVSNPWFKIGLQHSSRLSLYNDKYLSAPEMYFPSAPPEIIYGEDFYGYRTCTMSERVDGSILYNATYGGNGARIIAGKNKHITYGRGSKNYVGEIPDTIISPKLEKFRIFTLPSKIATNAYYQLAYKQACRGLFQFLVFDTNGVYRYGSITYTGDKYVDMDGWILDQGMQGANTKGFNKYRTINPALDTSYYRGIIKGSINKGDYLVFINPVTFSGISYDGKEIMQKHIVDTDFITGQSSITVYEITTDEFENETYRKFFLLDPDTNTYKEKLVKVKDNYLFELYPQLDALGVNYNKKLSYSRNIKTGEYELFKQDNRLYNWMQGRASWDDYRDCHIYNGDIKLVNDNTIDSNYTTFITPGQRVEKEDYKIYTGISVASTIDTTGTLKVQSVVYNKSGTPNIYLDSGGGVEYVYQKYNNIYVKKLKISIPEEDSKLIRYTPKLTIRKAKDLYSEIDKSKGYIQVGVEYRLDSEYDCIRLIADLYEIKWNEEYYYNEKIRKIDSVVLDTVNKEFIDYDNLQFCTMNIETENQSCKVTNMTSDWKPEQFCNRYYISKVEYDDLTEENFYKKLKPAYSSDSYQLDGGDISVSVGQTISMGNYNYIPTDSVLYTIQSNSRLSSDFQSNGYLRFNGPVFSKTYLRNTEENPYTIMYPADEELLMSVPSNPGYMYFEQFVVGGPDTSGNTVENKVEIPKEDIELKEEPNEKPKFETPEIDISSGPNTEEIKKDEDLTEEEKEEKLQEEEEQTSGGKNTEVEVDVGLIVDEDKLEEEGVELPKDEEGNEYIEVEIEVEVTDSLGNKYKIKKRVFYVNPRGKNNKNKGLFDLSSLGLPPNVKVDSIKVTITPEEEELKDKLDLEVKITIRDILNPATQQSVLENPALTLNGIIEIGELKENWTITSKSLSGNTKKIKLSDPLTAVEKYVIIKTRSKKESVIITDTITAEENFVINKEEVV